MNVLRYKDVAGFTFAKSRLFIRWCMAMLAVWTEMKKCRDDYENEIEEAEDRDWISNVDPRLCAAWVFMEGSVMWAMGQICDATIIDHPSNVDLRVLKGDVQRGDQEETKMIMKMLSSQLFPSLDEVRNATFIADGVSKGVAKGRSMRSKQASVARSKGAQASAVFKGMAARQVIETQNILKRHRERIMCV